MTNGAILAAVSDCHKEHLQHPGVNPNFTQIAGRHGIDRNTLRRHYNLSSHSDLPIEDGRLLLIPENSSARKFINKHSERLDSLIVGGMESSRHTAEYRPVFEKWFDLFEQRCLEENFGPENVYNMDEKGFMIGQQTKQRKIIPRSALIRGKTPYSRVDGSRTWTTIIGCVCADGTALTPPVIFQGKNVGENWLSELSDEEKFFVTTSEKGWTSHEIGLNWLKEVFDPLTRDKPNNRIRLLIVDGHSSHVNTEFFELCDTLRIRLLVLPPHSTHCLQPLDIGLFSPLTTAYTVLLNEEHTKFMGTINISKSSFYRIFIAAWNKSITPVNIKSAFAKAGMFPHDRSKVMDSVFKATVPTIAPPPTPDLPRTPSPPPAQLQQLHSSPMREGSSQKLVNKVRKNKKKAPAAVFKQHKYIKCLESELRLSRMENDNLREGLKQTANKKAFKAIVPGQVRGEGFFVGPNQLQELRKEREEQERLEALKEIDKQARKDAAAAKKAEAVL